MPSIKKTRIVNFYIRSSAFATIFKRLRGDRSDYDFSALADLRHLLNNEKARILNTIKNQNPKSVYQLAKTLDRDFKSVWEDLKLLEKFGFVEFKELKDGKRTKLKPEIVLDNLQINISFQ
jgi:predicted transcriptional regulator